MGNYFLNYSICQKSPVIFSKYTTPHVKQIRILGHTVMPNDAEAVILNNNFKLIIVISFFTLVQNKLISKTKM